MDASHDGEATSGPMTISNVITIVRILLVPVFVAALLAPWPDWIGLGNIFSENWKSLIAAGLFVVISGTDWLDGYLARSRNEVTDFGKFMDPLADKILVCAALICLVELGDLPTWAVLIILAREFIVSGVRMMAATKGEVIAASMVGKFKTVFQMIAIVLFTVKGSHMVGSLGNAFGDALWVVSWIVMIVALVLTVVSLVDYLYKARMLIGLTASDASVHAVADVSELEEVMLVRSAIGHGVTVCSAESLTGGMIGAAITSVPGSSAVYKGGIVSYACEVKESELGVDGSVLEQYGAVSEPVAVQMAQGARAKLKTDFAVAVTGLAGPDGDDFGNPVGTVWIALAGPDGTHAVRQQFEGGRVDVREQTVSYAVHMLRCAVDGTDAQSR